MAGILEPVAELAGQRGLTGTLKAGEHDDRRRVLREVQRTIDALAEHVGELLVDDLHHLLGGVECVGHLGSQCALTHLAGEGTHHVERHVGVEQRTADFTDRTVDIRLGSLPLLFRCLNAFESLSVKDEKAAIMGNSLAATREIAVLGTTLSGECVA